MKTMRILLLPFVIAFFLSTESTFSKEVILQKTVSDKNASLLDNIRKPLCISSPESFKGRIEDFSIEWPVILLIGDFNDQERNRLWLPLKEFTEHRQQVFVSDINVKCGDDKNLLEQLERVDPKGCENISLFSGQAFLIREGVTLNSDSDAKCGIIPIPVDRKDWEFFLRFMNMANNRWFSSWLID